MQPQRSLIGSKLRAKRKALGLSQVELAARAGISASYLNLIESNRRNVAGALLQRLAEALALPLEFIDGAAERRLVDGLAEIRGAPVLASLALDPEPIADLVARYPGWAQALVNLHRAQVDGLATVNALADRLNQDPALAGAVHSLLTHVSSIRSAAEILEQDSALDAVQRRRFVANVVDDSQRLSEVAQRLAGFFTGSLTGTHSLTPADEVDDFFIDHDNHFPTLEEAADALREALRLPPEGAGLEEALCQYLRAQHGVTIQRAAPGPGASATSLRQISSFDAQTRRFTLSEWAFDTTRRFELARLAAELGAAAALDALVRAPRMPLSPPAQRRVRRALAAYVAGAVLMPYARFLSAAQTQRYDIDRLAGRFGCSIEQVCHRLVTLRRPGAQGLRFGFLRANVAGRVSKRLPLPRLALPRHGAVCPLWAVYEAFQVNGALVRQLAAFPNGERFLMLARTAEKERPGFGLPRHLLSLMLMCEPLEADQLVYADGMDLGPTAPATPVGATCRVCVRRDCAYRQEELIVDSTGKSPVDVPDLGD